jgi:glutathione S-transferase|tara:strand:- start:431 stop:814 length:384 start_codon:yes stop_codon:yes gene_type:complete
MSYVILVTALLLIQYTFFSMRAGAARGKGDVKAPAMSGDDNFERCLRVQMNTLEQLAVTLPAMWICAAYFRADVAAILGAAFLISRFIYSAAYLNDASKRGLGMMIGFFANMILILCCLYVAIVGLI